MRHAFFWEKARLLFRSVGFLQQKPRCACGGRVAITAQKRAGSFWNEVGAFEAYLDRLIERGGKVIDIAPTKAKFLKALLSRSGSAVFADVKAENLQRVVDLVCAEKLSLPVVETLSLAEALVLMATMEQGKRVNGKAVITF